MAREAFGGTLYRMYNSLGQLLYIGITTRGNAGRFHEHARDKPWWKEVHSINCQHFTTAHATERAERLAIQTERPKYNVTHNGGRSTPEPVVAVGTPGELITIQEAAARLGCHPATVRRRIAEGVIEGHRFGPRSIRIDAAQLDTALRSIPSAVA
jgi:excisionase family DNA binding protein